jgi:hypothetical protein
VQLPEAWYPLGPSLEPFPVARGQVNQVNSNQAIVVWDSYFSNGLTNSTQWNANQWVNYELRMTSGTNTGQRYTIINSGFNSLTINRDLSAAGVAPGDAWELLPTLEDYLGNQLIDGDIAGVYSQGNLVELWCSDSGEWLDAEGQSAVFSAVTGEGFWLDLVQTNGTRRLMLLGKLNGDVGGVFVSTGLQVISFPSVEPPLNLDSLDWLALGATAGSQPDQSDQFNVYDATSRSSHACWLNVATGRWQWQDTGTDAGSTPLLPTAGYVYQHVGTGFYLRWR